MCMLSCFIHVTTLSNTMGHMPPARLLCPWHFPGNDTEVGCHALFQGLFLTQGSNPHFLCLPHWQMGSLRLALPDKLQSTSGWLS